LIRLANHNPSDNEANLAARKVCKIIAENDFAFLKPTQPRTAADKMREHASNYSGPTTWNDVKRSTEPEFKSRTYYSASNHNPTSNPFEDFFKSYWNGFAYGQRGGKSWTDSAPHKDAPTDDNWDKETKSRPEYKTAYPKDDMYDPITGERKPKRQEIRKCSKCGLEIPTFRINEVPWICNPCHWKDAL